MKNVRTEVIRLKGIVKDVPPMSLIGEPVWTGGNNVRFNDDATVRTGGYAKLADPLPADTQPIFLQPVLTPITSYWLWVSVNAAGTVYKIWATDGVNHFDVTPATITGGEAGDWTGDLLNNLPVLNNGRDAPWWWDGDTGNPMQPLPDWPANTICKSLRAFKYHLVAMNITVNGVPVPERVMWSSAADPGTVPASWTPDPSNDAGDALLATELGGIVDGGPLRDKFCIYRQHSTAVMSYVAGQYVFAFSELFVSTGIQSLNCWVEMRGKHYVFADDDVIVHDGNQFQSIVDKRVRHFLLRGINPDNQKLTQLAGRTESDEIWIIAPTVDNTYQSVAVIYSFVDDTFGVRELPNTAYIANGIIPNETPDATWDGATTTWAEDPRYWNQANYEISNDELLMADPSGRLLHVDSVLNNDGDPVESYIERLYWQIEGVEGIWENKYIRSIYPRLTGSTGDTVEVRVGASSDVNEPITWGASATYTIGSGPQKVDVAVHGRYYHFRISSTGGDIWELHRIGIEYVPMARY
jgi:hypothetical protein